MLPQSPWIINGERKAESSIEELICDKLCNFIKSKGTRNRVVAQLSYMSKYVSRIYFLLTIHFVDYKLSAAGREDVDVKMLGNGKYFLTSMLQCTQILLYYFPFGKMYSLSRPAVLC